MSGRRFDVLAEVEAPLFRILVESNAQNGLRIPSRLMVDKLTTARKDKLGARIGRLDQEDIVRLNQAIIVVLGLARSPRHDADATDPLPTSG